MMRNMFKRCLATVLAVAMVVTSVQSGWGIVSKAEELSTYTDGNIVADNHNVTDEESAILNSAVLDVTEYKVVKPLQADALTVVDSNNKVVYAKNFKSGDYTWTAEEVCIMVGEDKKEEVLFDKAECTYEGESYDASKVFAFNGNDYTVRVIYKLSMNLSAATQQNVINLPYYLADAMNSMDVMNNARFSLDEVVENATDYREQVESSIEKIESIGLRVPESVRNALPVLKSWEAQQAKYGKSEMSYLLTREEGYNNASRKAENIIAYGDKYEASAKQAYADVQTILNMGEYLDTALGDYKDAAVKTLTTIQTTLEPAAKEWPVLDVEKVLKADLEDAVYGDFDKKVANAIGKSEEHTLSDPTTKYTVDTVAIDCNVNRYNVTIQVKAEVVDADNKTVNLETVEKAINLAGGTTKAAVEKEIANSGVETEALQAWNALAGEYNVSDANYKRTTTELDKTLEEDVTYVITYTPNEYKVTCTNDSDVKEEKVPYGYTYTFPKANEDGKSYEYTVKGETEPRDEGTTYRVLGDLEYTRKLGKEKTSIRLLDIVVDNYADVLSTEAQTILKNRAVSSRTVSIREVDDLVKIDGNVVNVPEYEAAYGMTWVPATVTVLNGATVVETITTFTDGKATITADDYTKVNVDYRLDITLEAGELEAMLKLPNTLVSEAHQQLADMASLVSYENDLKEIMIGRLNLVKSDLSEESGKAVDNIAAICNEDGVLYLSTYITAYKALTDDQARLNYYYQNEMYSKIKKDAIVLADSMEILVADPALPEVLKSLGFESYVDRLEEASEKVGQLKDKFPAKNEAINLANEQYNKLLSAILIDVTMVPVITGNGLALNETFTKTSTSRAIVKVVVNVTDADGNVVETLVNSSADFLKKDGLTNAELKAFTDEIAAAEAKVDTVHYASKVEGSLPKAGEALKGDVTYTITWSPVTYTLKLDGTEDTFEFTYESMTVKLPAPSTSDEKYIYTIGSATYTVEYGDEGYVRLTTAQFDELFKDDDVASMSKAVIDVREERNENFVNALNEAVEETGASDVLSFVLCKDEDGKTAIVVRVNPFSKALKGATMSIGEYLVGQPYVALNGDVLVGSEGEGLPTGVHVDTIADVLLKSGISTSSIIAMINEDGTLINTTQAEVGKDGYTTVTGTAGELGALLLETSIAITTSDDYAMPLYVSLTGDNTDASKYAALRSRLIQLEKVATVELSNGDVNVEVTLPEKVHELYLSAMLATGAWDLDDEMPTLTEMVDFILNTGIDELVLSGNVNADTIINTAAQAGIDINEYRQTLETLVSYMNKTFDGEGSDITIVDVSDDNDFYKVNVCVEENLIQKAISQVNATVGDKVLGDVATNLNVTLTNCNTEYTAIVVDAKAEKLYNKVDLVTTKDIETNGKYAVVLLLDDVDTLTVNSRTFLDLHGNRVGKLVSNAAVTVFDSTLATNTNGGIDKITDTENVTLTAGTYNIGILSSLFGKGFTKAEIESMLPEGYEVNSEGQVSNQFYELIKDENGNITVAFTANYVKVRDIAYEELALEIALDVVLNSYNQWAALDVDGNSIYNIEILDAIATLKGGVKGAVSTVIDFVDYENVRVLTNQILADMTNFAGMEEATLSGLPFASYGLTTYTWEAKATIADENYITLALKTVPRNDVTVSLKLGKQGEDIKEATDLLGALADVVTSKIELTALSFDYDENEGFSYAFGGNIDVEVDLTQHPEYLPVMGIVLAHGMEDGAAKDNMVEAIEAYLADDDAKVADLVAAIEDITSADIVNALVAAQDTTFTKMVKELGIKKAVSSDKEELGAAYEEVLSIMGKVIDLVGITGGGRTLESFKLNGYEGQYVYGIDKEQVRGYNLNAKLILKLANVDGTEPPVDPVDPVNPVDPDQPSKPGPSETTTGIKTGDDANIVMWTTLMVAAVLTLGCVVTRKRKVQ